MFSHTCSSAHSLPSCIVRKCSFQASLSVSGFRTSISLYLGGPEFISQAIYPFPLPTLARQFTSLCCFPTPPLSLLIFLLSLRGMSSCVNCLTSARAVATSPSSCSFSCSCPRRWGRFRVRGLVPLLEGRC